tara:strand:- start:3835 stop:4080 length:246 start_codon:yes stop_codon:yes gene_type:complete
MTLTYRQLLRLTRLAQRTEHQSEEYSRDYWNSQANRSELVDVLEELQYQLRNTNEDSLNVIVTSRTRTLQDEGREEQHLLG